jgi:hypothetical protein
MALLSCFGQGFSSLRSKGDVDGKTRVRCVHQRGRRPGNIYNEWYTDVHLKDVLKVPGIVAAQRFKLSDVQRDAPPFPWQYLALYEIETDDLNRTLAELRERAGTSAMVISNAVAVERAGWFFQTDHAEG